MSNYIKGTNFTVKDTLPTGNASKVVRGAEIDDELVAIASAITSKADSSNPVLTGVMTGDLTINGGTY
jgi:hypoxanthine-guanine phosphoribosyltransferase